MSQLDQRLLGVRIETDRLLMRPPQLEDLDGWVELLSDEENARYIGGVHTRGEAWRSLATMRGAWHLHGISNFSVIEKATGRWVGRVGPWQPADWPGPEIGWSILRSHWGKGFATEAAIAAVSWAKATLGWSHMIHVIHPANRASIAVARKLGSDQLSNIDLWMFKSVPKPLIFGQELSHWTGASVPHARSTQVT